jgi:predicted Ser/Thr protein kinase
MSKTPTRREKMIENGLILTGSEAELLSRALSEVKTKAYEESEVNLDDAQALDALVAYFKTAAKERQEKERCHSYLSPLRKRLVLGTLLDRAGGADRR